MFQKYMLKAGYEEREGKRYDAADKGHHCKPETIARLWHGLSCPLKVNQGGISNGDTVARIGVSVEATLYEKDRSLWERVRDKLIKQTTGKNLDQGLNEVADIVLEVRRMRRYGVEKEITAFIEVVGSNSSGKNQIWILIDFALSPSKYTAFPREVYKNLLQSQGDLPLKLLEPHPRFEQIKALAEEVSARPLEANRVDRLAHLRPKVPDIVDDGLSAKDRQESLGFVVIDERKIDEHQVEGVVFRGMNNLVGLDGTAERLNRRLPRGGVHTVEEINAFCGEFCRGYRKVTKDWEIPVVFRLVPYYRGANTYTTLEVEVFIDRGPR